MAHTFLQLQGRVMDIPHRPKNQDLTEIKALINESYAYIVAELGTLQKSVTKALTPALGDYNLLIDLELADYAATRALYYTAASGLVNYRPLSPTSLPELIALRQANTTATSPATTYASAGWGNIMLQPLPSVGDTLTVVYVAYPDALVNEGDTPTGLPTHLQHLIVSHAAAVAMEQVDVNYAQRMREEFEERELKRARRWLNGHLSASPFAPGANRSSTRWPSDVWYGN